MMMAAMMPEKSAISPHVTAFLVLVIPTLPKYVVSQYFDDIGYGNFKDDVHTTLQVQT